MKGDKVILDGVLTDPREVASDLESLLSTNYVYCRIHALEHRPLHGEMVVEVANSSLKRLYNIDLPLTGGQLQNNVGQLLHENRYPAMGSNMLTLYLMPDRGYLLCCTSQLLYKGYTLWHVAQKAEVLCYDTSLPTHQTASSLTAHNYALQYGRGRGIDVVLSENSAGIVTSAGEYPLFVLRGDGVFTTPLDQGVPDSVERRICIEACVKAGYKVFQQPIEGGSIEQNDELFFFSPQGIFPIKSCGNQIFPDIAARRIASFLDK